MKHNRLLKYFLILFLPVFMGFTKGDCNLLNLVFFAECSPIDPFFIANDAGRLGTEESVKICDSGKIYVEKEYCRSGYELFLVSNEPDLNSIDDGFFSETTSIIVGDNGTIIRHSLDNQYQFIIMNSPTQNDLNSVARKWETSIYFAVGNSGTVIKSTDDGLTWNFLNFPSNEDLLSVYVYWDTIFVSGSNYTFYGSTDGGNNWFPLGPGNREQSGPQFSYNRIYFYDDYLGFVGGPHGLILKTTDGGDTWESKFAQGFSEVYDLYFISPDSGAAVGPGGVARFTTDGGDTWFEDTSVTNYLDGRDVKRIVPFGKYYGTVVGSGLSTFIAPDSTYLDSIPGVTSVGNDNQLPTEYALYQNYPNPFNPSTAIRYQVSGISHITLKVYDLLGNEIATLVNEEKYPGNHSVEFNASGLSSGIYFYQLQAGEFTETKKLVLLK